MQTADAPPVRVQRACRRGGSTKQKSKAKLSQAAVAADAWDISRLNQHWAIDAELQQTLPFLARAKRDAKESPADKFLRLSKLSLPAPPLSECLLLDIAPSAEEQASAQRAVVLNAETKTKYFGAAARRECFAVFRKLAAQKYLTMTPLHDALEQRAQMQDGDASGARGEDEDDDSQAGGANEVGLFTRQVTARHRFTSLCLERDLPPCLRLIIRNYFSPEINVSHMAIGDELATVFADCLLDLPMVTGLNIRNNRLGDRGLEAIIDVVVAKKDLYHLDLSENKVDGCAAAALAMYIASTSCVLQTLRLSTADVDDSELAPFAKALHTNKSLHVLDLSHNKLGNTENLNVVQPSITTGGEALATMLSINTTLAVLDLSWNVLRLAGAVEIGRALGYNDGLREINLAYNAFGNQGAQAIGEALLSNQVLEKLNLSNNNVPAQGAQAIASALKLNRNLVQLNMDGNPLGQTGGRALLHAVASSDDRELKVTMEGCNFDMSDSDAFDPSETTGSYDLNLSIPYERAIALELLRIANTKQGCKFLSIMHTPSGSTHPRAIKTELREAEGSDARRRLLKTPGILTDLRNDQEQLKQSSLDKDSLIALFHELDVDSSGFIDEAELTVGMKKLGITFRDEDIPRYVAQYDLDDTGTIELNEFLELMASFNLDSDHFARQLFDVDTNQPFTIPTEGQLQLDFVDFHVSADQDNAHSQAGVERLIENISSSKDKSKMLEMAKSGLYFRSNEAQLLLDAVADVFEITQAVTMLLPNMVDPKSAHMLMDRNLSTSQRLRVQHLMGSALQPMLGLGTAHYRIDLGNDLDRLTLKKIVENSTRTAFLRKRQGLKDTSQHANYHGFRNETLNGKSIVVEPEFLDTMSKFGVLELDYVQIGRQPCQPMSNKRFNQLLRNLQIEQMAPAVGVRVVESPPSTSLSTSPGRRTSSSTASSDTAKTPTSRTASREAPTPPSKPTTAATSRSPFPPLHPNTRALFAEMDKMKTIKNYIAFGDGLNKVVELQQLGAEVAPTQAPADADEGENEDSANKADDTVDESITVLTRDGRETCTARRLLLNLQWYLATRWMTAQQGVRLLSLWPKAFEATRVDAACVVFDRLVDLHNFNGILSALSEAEAAQCLYRLGWLNTWTPLMVDNYYELQLSIYEEREVAKALVRLAIDEPGENWQNETFGWTRDELIPGWELNLSWLKDGGFPEKGFLCVEYYSGADKGCGPVWPTRRELASCTLCGLPENVDELIQYVDSQSMMKRRRATTVRAPSN